MAFKKFRYSHFIFGVVLLTALNGCRFGNYAEEPKPLPLASSGMTYELFSAHANRLETVAIFDNTNTQGYRDNVNLASIPTSILDTFSDPLFLGTPAMADESPMFIGKNQKNYIYTTINAAGNIDDESASEIVTLWKNPACQTQVQIDQLGSLDRSSHGDVIFDGQTYAKAGKILLELTYMRVIAGDCAEDLTEMAQCYQTPSGCTTDEWRAATNFFDLYVRQSGVLDIANASHIKGLAYIVHFE